MSNRVSALTPEAHRRVRPPPGAPTTVLLAAKERLPALAPQRIRGWFHVARS